MEKFSNSRIVNIVGGEGLRTKLNQAGHRSKNYFWR